MFLWCGNGEKSRAGCARRRRHQPARVAPPACAHPIASPAPSRLALAPEQTLFLFCSGTLPTTGTLLRELASTYADADGFLYLLYAAENTFGGGDGVAE